MKRYLLSASAAAALMLSFTLVPAGAFAQDSTTTTGTVMASPSAVDTAKLIGRNIVNTNGDTVGEIDSVVIDQSGKVRYVIVGVGGFLGIGKKDVALAWDELAISENGEKVTTTATKDQLAVLPEHKFPEAVKPGTVYSYDEAVKSNPTLGSPEQMAPAAGTVGIKASKLVGATVKNAKGESIGEIHEIVLAGDGAAQGLVIDVGGFLGMNERPVLVKWSDVSIQSDTNGAVVVATNMEKAQLEQLPEYKLQ
jgi:sporulation protein YlmC with PRC-barrel domain